MDPHHRVSDGRALHQCANMTQTAINDDLIYVVDDDRSISKLVALNLMTRGYQVKQFDNGNAVLDRLAPDGIRSRQVNGFKVVLNFLAKYHIIQIGVAQVK